MVDFISTLQKEVDQEVQLLDLEGNAVQQAQEAIDILSDVVGRLKQFIGQYEFHSLEEEIYFFKEVKPKFISRLIYYIKVYNVEMGRPLGSVKVQVKYYRQEQEDIQKYMGKHIDFVRYVRSGSSFLDESMFTRGVGSMEYRKDYLFDRDPEFSTASDFKVAELLAFELLQGYISMAIQRLEGADEQVAGTAIPRVKVTWTGKKNELIELLYGLDSMGCFNSGNISLAKLMSYFEQVFNVDLRNFSRDFTEMKIRNEQTPFLDKLKKLILDRMSNPKGWKRKG